MASKQDIDEIMTAWRTFALDPHNALKDMAEVASEAIGDLEKWRDRAEEAEARLGVLEAANRNQRLSASKVIEAVLQWGGHQEGCVFDTEGCSCGWHTVCEALDHHKDKINGK